MIYLTECDEGRMGGRIEASSWEDAEIKLAMYIALLELPPDTQVIGELVEEWPQWATSTE